MISERVEAVRSFNRFWTTRVGLLQSGLLDTPYSLTEARVIFELAQDDRTELVHLRQRLGLDAGYVSRVIARLRELGLVTSITSPEDARRVVLGLTNKGKKVYRDLNGRSDSQVRVMLDELSSEDQSRLVAAMSTIEELLGPQPSPEAYVIRSLHPGDIGWVLHRHGVLYDQEYGWDQSFEALVSRIVADYADHHDPKKENAWIAEMHGKPVGCVFCVRGDHETARLRLLLVEPRARGRGLGTRLVAECIRFARRAGYRKLSLWTNDVLVSARRIYEEAGFELVHEAPHHSFGHDLVEQVWELGLS